jgi:soluble lytic murein transglycosylase
MEKRVKHRMTMTLSIFFSIALVGLSTQAGADIYKRVHADGHSEFTNRPSGPGWVFYMKESGDIPNITFSHPDRPKSVDEIMREIASQYEIDPALVKAIITVESKSDPMAVSRKGAQGLMQLMPGIAKDLKVSKPFDPRENIIGGVKYIKGLLASYGDLALALAAYNAGPGAVKKYAGIPPYRETVGYVKKVLHYHRKYQRESNLHFAGGHSGPR